MQHEQSSTNDASASSAPAAVVGANETRARELDLAVDNPLLSFLGVRLESIGVGICEFELEIEPRHLNRSGALQGGVAATMLDVACGYAGLLDEAGVLARAVTIGLSVNYMGKVSSGRVRAIGRVVRSGRSIYFSSAELVSQDGELLAMAQGSFKRMSQGA